MNRVVGTIGALILSIAIGCSGVEWKEIDGGATVVTDRGSGLPAVAFNATVAYDNVPAKMALRISWQVFVIDDGTRTLIDSYSRERLQSVAMPAISTISPRVSIEAGKRYEGQVVLEDLENAIVFRRTYSYDVALAFPIALRLVDWNGSEEADLSNLSDGEIQELAQMAKDIRTYEVLAEGVNLAQLFANHAPADGDYPVAVLLLPDTGISGNWGTAAQPITATFGLSALVYAIDSRDAVTGYLQQLSADEHVFVGTAYAGPIGDHLGQGHVVFVHNAMNVILEAAIAERTSREI